MIDPGVLVAIGADLPGRGKGGRKRNPSHPTSKSAKRVMTTETTTSQRNHSGILEKAEPIRAFKTSGRVIKR